MYGYRAVKIRTFWSVLGWESAEILHRTHGKIQTSGVNPASSQKSDAPNTPGGMIAACHWNGDGLLSANSGHSRIQRSAASQTPLRRCLFLYLAFAPELPRRHGFF